MRFTGKKGLKFELMRYYDIQVIQIDCQNRSITNMMQTNDYSGAAKYINNKIV